MCKSDNDASADILTQFSKVRYGRYKGVVTPHKQLLILFVLIKYRCNSERLIPYCEIESALAKISKRYFPEIKVFHANYPFWRLQNDGVWEVTQIEHFSHRSLKSDINRREFIRHDAYGGLTEPLYRAISADTELCDTTIRMVAGNLPNAIQNDILWDLGFENETSDFAYKQNKSQVFLDFLTLEDSEELIVLS